MAFITRGQLSFSQILRAFPESILVTNTKGEIYYVNPAWEKSTGYNLDEVRGKNPRFLKTEQTDPKIFRKLWKYLIQNKPFFTENMIDKRKNGEHYQIYSTFFPIIENDTHSFYVQVQHDITQRKDSEKLKSETLSLASHELKTPLTVLKLLSSKLRKYNQKSKIIQKDLDLMDRQIDILIHLINNMLDVSKIETGKMVMSFCSVNLTQLIKQSVKRSNLLLKKKIKLQTSQKDLVVWGDEYRLDQVITNLLNNAIKFSPTDSLITVKLDKNSNTAIVSVSDKGKGITSSNLKKIFRKYFQVTKGKGMGLGLAISKEIIYKHKGKIWATSVKNKGSTFYFSLPLLIN